MGIRTSNYIEFIPSNINNNTKQIKNNNRLDHFNYINHINNHISLIKQHENIKFFDNQDFTTFINQRLNIWDNNNNNINNDIYKENISNQYILTRLYKNNNSLCDTTNIYGCKNCKTQLSSTLNIMSRDYRGITGDAYLMSQVINIDEGDYELRTMITGDYLVCDIMCQMCHNIVGWKYINAERVDQRYKEGKFILELQTISIVE